MPMYDTRCTSRAWSAVAPVAVACGSSRGKNKVAPGLRASTPGLSLPPPPSAVEQKSHTRGAQPGVSPFGHGSSPSHSEHASAFAVAPAHFSADCWQVTVCALAASKRFA
eukprot:scaffold8336_cov63-Phaeocystis_antarctica.AAC.6